MASLGIWEGFRVIPREGLGRKTGKLGFIGLKAGRKLGNSSKLRLKGLRKGFGRKGRLRKQEFYF